MFKIRRLTISFHFKVTLILICSMLIVLLLSNLLIYKFTLDAQFDAIRSRLKIIAQTASLLVDASLLEEIPLKKEGVESPFYIAVVSSVRKVKEANPLVKYIYAMKKTEQPGIWQFIFDVDTLPSLLPRQKGNRSSEVLSYPGDLYDAGRFPEMLKAFDGPSADRKLEVDEWGPSLSGYAPIKDEKGQAVAVIGIDVAANDIYAMQREYHHRTWFVILLGILMSFVLAIPIAKPITDPIDRLVVGTRQIAKGNLQYRVEVDGHDEINELARDFNQMSRTLYKSRRRILGYFYKLVRTLVKVIEARDLYTKGHSEEVARYAGRIAFRMGFSRADVKLFRKMCVLHDLGKIGICDYILTKPDKLTEKEWEEVKKHPVLGEDIVHYALGREKFLEAIRGHHERFDGRGYPDGLTGEQMDLCSAIVAVADSYHAMISDRPYRKALSKEDAQKELRRFSGTQFHPKVVEIFLEILEEEKQRV